MWRWQGLPRTTEERLVRKDVVMEPLWSWQDDPERRGKEEKAGNMKEKSKLDSGLFARKDYVPFNR